MNCEITSLLLSGEGWCRGMVCFKMFGIGIGKMLINIAGSAVF